MGIPFNPPALGPINAAIAAQSRAARFKALMAAASLLNASDAAALSSSPTVTMQTGTTSGLTRTLNAVPSTVTAPNGTGTVPLFAMYGGSPIVYSVNYWKSAAATIPTGASVQGVANGKYGYGYRVAFMTNAPSFDIVTQSSFAGAKYRILIDGVYVSKSPYVSAVSGALVFNVNFNTSTRTWRRIDIEMDPSSAFAGVNISPIDNIKRAPTANRYRIGAMTDSYGGSVGADCWGNGHAQHAARRLGNMDLDIVTHALGGTGYLNTNSGNGWWTFRSHITDPVTFVAEDGSPIDEVWIMGGINDKAYGASAVQAEALLCFRALRASGFSGPVVVWGSYSNDNTNLLAIENAILAAFNAWGDPNSYYIPMITQPVPLQSSSQLAASVTGSVSGSVLTVTSVASGTLAVGQYLLNNLLPMGTTITSFGTGSGGTGTYNLSASATISSTTFGAATASGGGNWALFGGGATGIDTTHPNLYGHDYMGKFEACERARLGAI